MGLTVAEALGEQLPGGARLLAGGAVAAEREIRWCAVIEWPVEDFVRPGELVLSTALGCDEERFARLVAEVADSGAAALCVALHRGGPLREVPAAVIADAERRGLPLVALPWDVRFAEVMLALADRLIGDRYAAALEASDGPLGSFAGALLGGAGLSAIATALEELVEHPVVVLDAALRLVAHGGRAVRALPAALAAPDAALMLDRAAVERARCALESAAPQRVEPLAALSLPAGTAVAAMARHRTLGYVWIGTELLPALERRALAHAATATAMELVRMRAVAESEARVRGDFLWGVATGAAGGSRQIAANAVLLGYDLRAEQRVALGRARGADPAARVRAAEQVAHELAVRAPRSALVAREREWLLVLHRDAGDPAELTQLLGAAGASLSPVRRPSWGVAEQPVTLAELEHGHRRALQLLEVGEVVLGPGAVGDARSLGPQLLLARLVEDADAVAIARAPLAPLLDHDRDSGRDLLGTLEVYLREHGNVSAAARALFLNRRSMTHRLQRIAALTGRSLDRPDDRFLLDLSLKLLRLHEARERRPVPPTVGEGPPT